MSNDDFTDQIEELWLTSVAQRENLNPRRNSNPWRPRYWPDALSTELWRLTVCLANYYDCRTVSERWKKVWLKEIPTVYSFSYLLFGDNILVTLGHSRYQNPGWNATSQLFPVHKRKKALDNHTMYIKHALWSTEFKRPWCNIKIRAYRFQVCSKFNPAPSSMF